MSDEAHLQPPGTPHEPGQRRGELSEQEHEPAAQTLRSRLINGDDDYWRIHRLLVETHPITGPGHNWDARRWEGWRYYRADPAWDPKWDTRARLWETADGRLVGTVHHEGRGDAHLQVHPAFRAIEKDMIKWAEHHLAAPDGAGASLRVHVFEYDAPRCALLEKRGFEKTTSGGVTRLMRFVGQPLPPPVIADGYKFRATRPDEAADPQRIADVLNAGFGRDRHTAEEYSTFTEMAPSFRQELDLVAEAADGSFAAYVGVPYDEANRFGIFEPVCTHPDHRRHGLARALMLEGLRRLQSIGAAEVTVETGDQVAANRLYDGIGFTEAHKGFVWRKAL